MKNRLTDEEVSKEIERLRKSENVKLARAEVRVKYKERQKLYLLRYYEKRGAELAAAGVTLETIAQK